MMMTQAYVNVLSPLLSDSATWYRVSLPHCVCCSET